MNAEFGLIASAMFLAYTISQIPWDPGIEKGDKSKKYKQRKGIDKILEDAEEFLEGSPYSIPQTKER